MANFITGLRIVSCIALMFCDALSPIFYAIYLFAGITDMVDGAIARKTNTVSEIGSKLDTIADILLVTVVLIMIIPILDIDMWMYGWIMLIAAIKFSTIVFGYISSKKFVALHSIFNKTTGIIIFILPFTFSLIDLRISAIFACSVATAAAIHEAYCVINNKKNYK